MRAKLPKVFRSHNVSSEDLSEELTDGFAYKLSDADRVALGGEGDGWWVSARASSLGSLLPTARVRKGYWRKAC